MLENVVIKDRPVYLEKICTISIQRQSLDNPQ